METLHELEAAVARLPREDFVRFRAWLDEYAATSWDRQFEEDVAAGRLDALRAEALADLEAGSCTEL